MYKPNNSNPSCSARMKNPVFVKNTGFFVFIEVFSGLDV
jgi:hypothetical protein